MDNTFSATCEQGLKLNVQIPQALNLQNTPPLVFQTLLPPSGISVTFATDIPTNFAKNDFILFTSDTPGTFLPNGNPAPLTIDFN